MKFYEVLIADSKYQADDPLTYNYDGKLPNGTVVTVPLRGRLVSGFVLGESNKPSFKTLPIKSILSDSSIPKHVIELASWLSSYYASSYSDALKQFAPTKTIKRRLDDKVLKLVTNKSPKFKPTDEQTFAIKKICSAKIGTYLLHGQTGSGKTYIYGELIKDAVNKGKSAIVLVPEIALTAQIYQYIDAIVDCDVVVFHSHLSSSQRKKLWFKVLESKEPLVVIGPRSALFTPVHNIGIIVVDECHEQTYKQEQSPRYSALRVASKLGEITSSKVIFGSATPGITDYYLADKHKAVVTLNSMAKSHIQSVDIEVVDLKDKAQFSKNQFISGQMIKRITQTLNSGQQALIYLNRRGSARLIMCDVCGWQLLCPNCDTPLTYHSDSHIALCHGCGYKTIPPNQCPSCSSPDVIYKSVGTKAIAQSLESIFPNKVISRFDGDSKDGERFEQNFKQIIEGKVDIIVGTQIISKGIDLPKLGMVGVVIAETSLYLPDYTADERTFQIIYQLLGRVGRGHSKAKARAVIQTYHPESKIISSAINKNWAEFYKTTLDERRTYRFPPFSHILKLSCKRQTEKGAINASQNLYKSLISSGIGNAQIIGPMPAFHYKKAGKYTQQIIIKSKSRSILIEYAKLATPGWTIDLDPSNLL